MVSVPELLVFQKIFNDHARLRRHQLSCYHFSSIFLWRSFFSYDFKVIDGYLCVFAQHTLGSFLYFPPLGPELNAAIIEQCFRQMDAVNSKSSFSRIENVAQEDLKHFNPTKYKATEKSKEYCYLKEDIIGLRVNAFKSKRSSYNQFVKSYPNEFVSFEGRWTKDCLRLFDAWSKNRADRSNDEIYKAMLEENRGVHQEIFEYCNELGLEGRLVMIEGKPQAYTFGYPLNDETFCVVVEIINLDFKGLSVYVFNRFCADDRWQSFKWANVMDDFAMDNVARTKESFRPKALYPSYVITERE